ncbi:MAG: FHA domain-containing protein [Gemmatimonadota bacterium]
MNQENPAPAGTDGQRLMDELLRAGVPEIKLALGEAIDRENARPLPSRYARLLPETMLVVTLRQDAASALTQIAADLERELTDSCNRHGSLYDRSYRVKLQRSEDPEAPLYAVAAHAGRDVGAEPAEPPAKASAPAAPELPVSDPDATRTGGATPSGWEDGRWVLIVEGLQGDEREVFRLGEPSFTVGRHSDDPGLRATIAISDAPHVSRRQLTLVWEERDGASGFRVYNLGLNDVHMPGDEIPGARAGRDTKLDSIADEHVGWLPPGVPLRIGEKGPVLRIEEVPPDPEEVRIDPDATVFE